MKPVHETSLLAISWPVMLTLAVGISGPLIDSWFLSRISDTAAAGVGATIPVFMLGQTILNSLGQAGAGIAGQFLGARRRRMAEATFTLLLALVVGGGILLGALMALTAPWLVAGLGLKGEIAGHSTVFLRIIGIGFGSRALQSVQSNILASRGLTRWNLWSSVGIVGGNTLLNCLLVTGWFGLPCYGVMGVASATVGTWTLVAGITWLAMRHKLGFRPTVKGFLVGWRQVLSHLLRIGLPSMGEPISYMLFQLALATQVVRMGNLSLTSRVYASNLANLPVIFSYGLGFGAQILVSHLVGAKEYGLADNRLRKALAWGCGLAFLVALGNALLGRFSIGVFTKDHAVIALGASLLWVDFFLQPAKAANIAITFSLRAAGDSRFPAFVGTGLMWSLGLGACMGLAWGAGYGVVGIWAGMAMDEWIRAGVNWRRWQSGAWQTKGVAAAN
jgi:Na+-driven multidrug efflux pump